MKKIVVAIAVSVLFIVACQKVSAHHEPEGVLSHDVPQPTVVEKPEKKQKPQLCGSDMVNCF